MGYERYKKIRNFIIAKNLEKIVVRLTKILPLICYVAYPLGILALAIWDRDSLLRFILVPFLAFSFCTALRLILNLPRPYEIYPLPSLTGKSKKGQSFPSRHCVSASVIALAFLKLCTPLGIFFIALSVIIAITRVLSGVHFIKDTLVGTLMGTVFGIIGFFII